MIVLIQSQAAAIDLCPAEPTWGGEANARIDRLGAQIPEVEYALIPHGLHVVGQAPSAVERLETLSAIAEAGIPSKEMRLAAAAIVDGEKVESAIQATGMAANDALRATLAKIAEMNRLMAQDHELSALLRALDGRFIQPVAGGDLMRSPEILPTGRNMHGFDPYRIPSAFAMSDGARQAERVVARHVADGNAFPETVAVVLWGTDNLKSEGGPIGQALALLGAKARFDAYGRLCGAALIPLAELGRPRIDVVVTLSGIFRDLLPLQTRLIAEACYLAATADEPPEENFIRKHALAYQAKCGCSADIAALRVFSNAEGAYGANVGLLIDSGAWSDDDEISNTYSRRKSFAYSRKGDSSPQADLLGAVLETVDFSYQNLDSVELGVTSIDHYFDSLGGMGRAAKRARGGKQAPVYISDQTRGEGRVRSLSEQVALETRTRILNPKWYEGMLKYGYEGVRQIEAHVTHTMGWPATTGQVEPWVYEQITRTFVADPAMRERLAALNPAASAKMANRVMEAHARGYWKPDPELLAAMNLAGDELEDRLEGVTSEIAA